VLAGSGVITSGSASAEDTPRRIVNGWLPYWTMSSSMSSVTQNADLWGEASPFWYQATGATTITRHPGAGSTTIVETLRASGIKVVPTVTETLNAPAMAALVGDPTQRAAHVQTLVNLATGNGYDGIDLNYETMNFGGTSTDRLAVRTGFVTLVQELETALDGHGALLSVTVGPRARADDPNWSVFDYRGIGLSADRVRIMTYDYHWRGSTPGAVAPLGWVNTVLAYAVTAMPASKIEVGVPLYGYDWPADPTQPDGYGNATSRTYAQAEALRAQYGATRQWSSTDAAPYFTYTAPDGVQHVVWYNDTESTRAKMTFVEKYGLRGLVFWAVGAEDSRQWPVLRSYAIQRSTALTISAPSITTYGTAATVSGTLRTTSGVAVAGQRVVLQWRRANTTTWQTVASGTTSSTGAVSLRYAPPTNGSFRLVSQASWAYAASTSATVTTLVRWRVSAAFADSTVTRGTTVYLRGSVAPIRAGTAVQRQRLVNGSWVTISSGTVRTDGTYSFTFAWSTPGTYTYRVVVPGTSLNLIGYSPTRTLYVS
jgi:spore germination protein YaaH